MSVSDAVAGPKRRWFLGVEYLCQERPDGGWLYLTRFGEPWARWLEPENWFERSWFMARRQRLLGTSTICRLETKPVDGRTLSLVVRCSRVAERVPVDTDTLCQIVHVEFNSPFEEISLLTCLRAAPAERRIYTKKPLAIYSPPDRIEPWQSARSEDEFARKQRRHPSLPLEFTRSYFLLYGWIKGHDAELTADALGLKGEARVAFLRQVTDDAIRDLARSGFEMLDIKPAHIILRRRRDGSLLRHRNGRLAYALVDYELLTERREPPG